MNDYEVADKEALLEKPMAGDLDRSAEFRKTISDLIQGVSGLMDELKKLAQEGTPLKNGMTIRYGANPIYTQLSSVGMSNEAISKIDKDARASLYTDKFRNKTTFEMTEGKREMKIMFDGEAAEDPNDLQGSTPREVVSITAEAANGDFYNLSVAADDTVNEHTEHTDKLGGRQRDSKLITDADELAGPAQLPQLYRDELIPATG